MYLSFQSKIFCFLFFVVFTEQVNVTDVRTETQMKVDAWGQEVYGYTAAKDGTLECVMPEPTPFEPDNYSESFWTYDTPGIINPGQVRHVY